LRDVQGDAAELEARLKQVQAQGAPNYFGEQRFGRNEHNLVMAQRLFDGELTRLKPAQRGLYISAARSFLFNEILAERVRQQAWNQAWSGDVFQLDGSDKWFVDDGTAELATRVNELDIHPTGALVGAGELATQQDALKLETQVLAKHQAWCLALAELGLKQDRRALRVRPTNMSWQWLKPKTLQVSFDLAPGRYATAVVRELVTI
jgi:tRNA pseudouridine13 synthase